MSNFRDFISNFLAYHICQLLAENNDVDVNQFNLIAFQLPFNQKVCQALATEWADFGEDNFPHSYIAAHNNATSQWLTSFSWNVSL